MTEKKIIVTKSTVGKRLSQKKRMKNWLLDWFQCGNDEIMLLLQKGTVWPGLIQS